MKVFDSADSLNSRIDSDVAKKILDIIDALRSREVYCRETHDLREAHFHVRTKIEALAQTSLHLSPPDCCYFLLHLFHTAFRTLATALELPGASTCRDEPRTLFSGECSICLEQVINPNDAVVFSHCKHYICRACAHRQFTTNQGQKPCPHCRQQIYHQERFSSAKNQAMSVFGKPLKFSGDQPPPLGGGDLQKPVELSLREAPQLLAHPFGRFFWQDRVAHEDITPIVADQDNIVADLQQKIVFATKVESAATVFRRKLREVLEEEDVKGHATAEGHNHNHGQEGNSTAGMRSFGCSSSLWKHRKPITLHVLRRALLIAKSAAGSRQSKLARVVENTGRNFEFKTLDLLVSSGNSAFVDSTFRIPDLLRLLYVLRSKFSSQMFKGMTVANLKDSVRKAPAAEDAELSRLLSAFTEAACLVGISGTAIAKDSVEALEMVQVCEPQGICETMIVALLKWHNKLMQSGGPSARVRNLATASAGTRGEQGRASQGQGGEEAQAQSERNTVQACGDLPPEMERTFSRSTRTKHHGSKATKMNVVNALARYACSTSVNATDCTAESEQMGLTSFFVRLDLTRDVLPVAVAFRNSVATRNQFDLHSVSEILYHRYFAGKPFLPENLCELVFRLASKFDRTMATSRKNLQQWSAAPSDSAISLGENGGHAISGVQRNPTQATAFTTLVDKQHQQQSHFELFDSAVCASRSLQSEVGHWRLPELLDAISKMEMMCRFLAPTDTNSSSFVKQLGTGTSHLPLLQFVDTKLVNLSKELPAGLRKLFTGTAADAQLRVADAATLTQLLQVRRTVLISSSSSRGGGARKTLRGSLRQPFFKGKQFHESVPESVKPHLGRTIELQPTALIQWVCSLHQMLTLWVVHEDLAHDTAGGNKSPSSDKTTTSPSSDPENKRRDAARKAAQAFLLGEAGTQGDQDQASQAQDLPAQRAGRGAKPKAKSAAKAKAKSKAKAKAKGKAKAKAKSKAKEVVVADQEDDLLADDDLGQASGTQGRAKTKLLSGTAPATPAVQGASSQLWHAAGSSASRSGSAVQETQARQEDRSRHEVGEDVQQQSPQTPKTEAPRVDVLRPLPQHALWQYQPAGALPLPPRLQVRHAIALFFWLVDHLFDLGSQRGR
ncbi:unnamed protein product [Amoebophrya sp. A25]|nr:unnamed protein product [Amoebophrya sp. A25]|eukprot:GSA25T00002108001.1